MDPSEDDLNILASAGQIEPNVVRDADSTSYVLVASIPPAVLIAVDTLPYSFAFVEIGGYPCLAWLDWLRCKEELTITLMTRMTLRSHVWACVAPSHSTWLRRRFFRLGTLSEILILAAQSLSAFKQATRL